ncbi:MAG TPA: hypothetical protein VMB27_02300 [Solirubrobacteraceae bacterium]|nr:hypothetical protein [Solirubrobacteraceae bacterium]
MSTGPVVSTSITGQMLEVRDGVGVERAVEHRARRRSRQREHRHDRCPAQAAAVLDACRRAGDEDERRA